MFSELSEVESAVRDSVRTFAEREVLPAAARIDRDDRFPRPLYQAMGDLGLFGVALPTEFGGSGLGLATACMVMEEIARCSGAVGNAYALPVEAVRFLALYGTDAQKALIPGILSGETVVATAVSEPESGSDAAGMRTLAVRDGDSYVLDGVKSWVTLGGVADLIILLAKTSRDGGNRNISAFLVERDRAGMSFGLTEELMGMHGLEDCQITLADVRVPTTSRIGAENQAFKMAMEHFNFGRLLMAAMALGMAQAAFEDATAYARSRRQFGSPIIGFQAIQFMLADMSMDIAASRLLIQHAAHRDDQCLPIIKQAAHAKLFTTDMAMKHVSNALQIHGGNGYSRAYRIERIFRDVRLAQIYEGTNQIQRLIIARELEREWA